jgi:hypothetical protein
MKSILSVVIPSSVIPTHPSTDVIDQCYASVRFHLPDARVYILLDGLRLEDLTRKSAYDAYKNELKRRVREDPKWQNVTLVESSEFRHEAGQAREFLKSGICATPLVLWLQHDAVLLPEAIEWDEIAAVLQENTLSCVRFNIESDQYPVGKDDRLRGEIIAHGIRWPLITELFVMACRNCGQKIWVARDVLGRVQWHHVDRRIRRPWGGVAQLCEAPDGSTLISEQEAEPKID